jgi:hypothetical protein
MRHYILAVARGIGVGGGIVSLQGYPLPVLTTWICIVLLGIEAFFIYRDLWPIK